MAVLAVLGLAGSALARSPLVAELETLATRYHENPARLDAVRDGLARAVREEPDPETWIALARVCFIWGDVRATTAEQKLAAYAEGREAGRRAVELAPRAPLAHLFYGINTGRWGQTQGVMRSLFLLSDVREAARQTLELDPSLPAAYALAGNLDYEVPGCSAAAWSARRHPSGRASASISTSRRSASAWPRCSAGRGARPTRGGS